MVDVVTNHMAYLGSGSSVDYSIYTPFNSVSSIFFFFFFLGPNLSTPPNSFHKISLYGPNLTQTEIILPSLLSH